MGASTHRCIWTIAVGIALILVGTIYGGQGSGPAEPATAWHATPRIRQLTPTAAVYSGHRPDFIATVYECHRHGERIFSDARCGADAHMRSIRDPSRMDAQGTATPTRTLR